MYHVHIPFKDAEKKEYNEGPIRSGTNVKDSFEVTNPYG